MAKFSRDNLALVDEAAVTMDCGRQTLLARHPSKIIRAALLRNSALCAGALDILGDEVDALRNMTSSRVKASDE